MPRGKVKLSNEVKVLRGTAQPCRMNKPQQIISGGLTTTPKTKLKGTARKIFEYTACSLIHNGVLDILGVDLLIAYAREMAIYHDLMAEVEKEGYTIEVSTKNGTMTQINPKRKIAESALTNAKSIASEYGFTPASRSKISALTSPTKAKDDFSEFEEVE